MITDQQRIAELEALIANICATLKGPLSNEERAWWVADRKDAREELAVLKAREAK